MPDPIAAVADRLMRAVARTGCAKPEDAELATRIMREELKEFLAGPKYADERALVMTAPGRESLAFASLVTECARRIVAEKKQPVTAGV